MEAYFYFFNEHWVLTLELIIILIFILINELLILRNKKKFISINKAVDLINHENAKVFDIRNKSDFQSGYIKNSFNINILDITTHAYIIGKYKKNHIIICSKHNDINANKAIEVLKKQGLSKIYILKGGLQAWLNSGFPLTKKNK